MKSMLRFLSVLLLPLLGASCQNGTFPGGVKSGEVCELHHLELERKTVPIDYGLRRPDNNAPPREQESARFPHRTREVNGGCMPMPEKTAKITTCPQCDGAYAVWLKRRG